VPEGTKYPDSPCFFCGELCESISVWDPKYRCLDCDTEWRDPKSEDEYWVDGFAWDNEKAYQTWKTGRDLTTKMVPPDSEPLLTL
jgi:hypothetical protein